MNTLKQSLGTLVALLVLLPGAALAAGTGNAPDLTTHWISFVCLGLFVTAYALVVMEEWLHLRKSIPVLMGAGLIWTLIGIAYAQLGDTTSAGATLRHSLLEFAELFLFLLVAMTYINTLEERGVFDALRAWLVSRGLSLRQVFWITGLLAFFISPMADNMTTALVMASVAIAVGREHPRFVAVACINIVVAANAGGVWSPFGDITTLMVWQKGILGAHEFLPLFLPSVVNWLVPAVLMSFAVPAVQAPALDEQPRILDGGIFVIFMFVGTIALTVSLHTFLHLPPVLGMMGGLGALKLYSYALARRSGGHHHDHGGLTPATAGRPLNVFEQVARSEWDTLLFFYGIILCVGGLGTLGYLALGSQFMYGVLGATTANILVGIISAVVDNIPVMYAVLSMNPAMSDGQWMLVTLTAGVGGSLLAVGSAAGVAVMGQARGHYTFFGHLRWTWAIALGYAASIGMHFLINGHHFTAG